MAPPKASARWPEAPAAAPEPWEPAQPFVSLSTGVTSNRALAPREAAADAPPTGYLTLAETRSLLAEATNTMVTLPDTADALTVRRLAVRIQRLRVAVKLLSESEDGEKFVSDESLTKELGLLNRLLGGKGDSLGVPDTTSEDERTADRARLLRERGIGDDAAAARIIRVLESVMTRADPRAASPTGLHPPD